MVLVVVAGVAVSTAITFVSKPMYKSTTKLFVSTQSTDNTADLLQGSSFTQQRVKSYADLVTSPSVLDPVVRQLGIHIQRDKLVSRIAATVPLNEIIIQIDVLAEGPQRASTLANSIATSLTNVVSNIEQPVSGAASPVKLSIIQQGTVPLKPDSPKPLLNFALGLFIGLVLGIGLAVLRESLDTKIRSTTDLEALGQTNILGGITYDPDFVKNPLIVHSHPKSRRAEAFRQLRTNIQFVEAAQGRKSLIVTSAVPSDGKSTTISNLAIAMAQTGKRVLLIDCDLRKPKLHKYLGLEGSVGLTNYLIGQASLEDVVQPWGRTSLEVLPAGKVPPNPSELLGSEVMTRLLETVEREYDVVLIDTAPLLPVTDAAILATKTGGVVLVVSVGKTTKPQVKGALSHLENVDSKMLGFVMNRIPTRGAEAYQYRYSYKNGYGSYGAYGVYGETYQDIYAEAAEKLSLEEAEKSAKRQARAS